MIYQQKQFNSLFLVLKNLTQVQKVWHLLMNLKKNKFIKKFVATEFLSFWVHFPHLKKSKEISGNILLYMSTINIIWFMVPLNIMCNTEFVVILGHFLLFYPPDDPENFFKFWKFEKNPWRCYHLTHVHKKWQSYDKCIFLFCHFALFIALLST